MLKAIIERRIVVLLISILIVIAGVYSAMTLPIRIQPAVEAPFIKVSATVDPEVDIDKMEEEVTFPIENFVLNKNIVKEVLVTTNTKKMDMTIMLKDGSKDKDIDRLLQDVQQKLNGVSIDLDDSEVKRYSTADQEFMAIAIIPDDIHDVRVRDEVEDVLVSELQDIPDMKRVSHRIDMYDENYIFELRPEKVRSLERASMIADELKQSFSSPLLGSLSYEGEEYRVKSEADITNNGDIAQYRLQNGDPLTDLVNVTFERDIEDLVNKVNGKPYYNISLYISKTASEVKVAEQVREKMLELHGEQSSSWDYIYAWDSSEFISQAVKELIINIMIGSVVAALILLIIFRSIKTMMIIALSIPVCIMTTLIAINLYDFSINIVTLIGLGIGTGMIVDACIVVLENIFKKIQDGLSRLDAVVEGTKEVIGPVFSSVLTTVAVFVPFGALEGEIGKMAVEMAVTVTVSLITSLVVSITVIPIFSFRLIDKQEKESSFTNKVMNFYEKVLYYCLKRKARIFLFFIVVLVGSVYYLVVFVPKNYIPAVSPRELFVRYEIDENSSFDLNKQLMDETAEQIQEVQGVGDVFYWSNKDESHRGTFVIHYLPKNEMPVSDDEVNEQVKDIIENKIPYSFFSLGNGQQNTEGQTQISLTATQMDAILNGLPAIKDEVRILNGVTGVESTISEKSKQWVLDFSREQLLHYGIPRQEVEQYLSLVLNGIRDIDIKINGEDRKAEIVFPEMYRQTSDALYNIPIKENTYVTLDDVAELSLEPTSSNRVRTDGEYETTLTVYHEKENKDKVVAQLDSYIQGVSGDVKVEFAGREAQQSEGFQSLFNALLVALAVVFLILTVQFNRLRQPLIIFISLLFTGIGISLGFILTGRTFDIMAMIGVVMLAGIVVNNSIVLIDFINKNRDRYEDLRTAVLEGAKARLRPIFTTTLTTVGGLIPMLIGGTNTSEFQTPIATAVVFGLLFSTFISLLLVPMLYEVFERKSKNHRKSEHKEVEEVPGV